MDPEEPGAQPAAAPRTDTAVSPVIRGESVGIPTPVWGALVAEDLRRIGADGEFDPADPGAEGGLLPRPRRLLGWLSMLAFAATAVLHAFAVDAVARHDGELGSVLAWAAIAASVAAVAVGIVAAVLGRGRWLGVVGAIGGLLANPWIVMQVLRAFSG
ncbi:MAG: hypothetical protein BGO95_05695 [Micrococcales bacterium 73-13]|nr:MAG: hypothetical protein BGO95_05695 [Micrococcales bacterium 73-13]